MCELSNPLFEYKAFSFLEMPAWKKSPRDFLSSRPVAPEGLLLHSQGCVRSV